VARPRLGGENRIGRRASQHEEYEALGSFLLPCAVTRVSLLAVWCLLGATPRGQPWTPTVTLPQGRNGLRAWRMAVLSTFRALSLCRQVHGELMRSTLLDLTPIISATVCHQSNYIERYSRSIRKVRSLRAIQSRHVAGYGSRRRGFNTMRKVIDHGAVQQALRLSSKLKGFRRYNAPPASHQR